MGWVQEALSVGVSSSGRGRLLRLRAGAAQARPECPPAARSTEPSSFWRVHSTGVQRMCWRVWEGTGAGRPSGLPPGPGLQG